MKRLIPLLLALAGTSVFAQEEEDALLKMRDALRNSMLQLRDAQGKIAELQATEIANGREIEKLNAEIKKLNDRAMAERNASANTIAELNEKLTAREATIAGQETAIAKWRKEYGDAIAKARKAEAESKKRQGQIHDLERLTADQRAQNVMMYRVGMEILERYDNFWFGDALLAREPFVGNTKVKLQNLAQDGHDKLLAARIREGEPGAAAPQPEAAPPSAPAPEAQPASQSAAEPQQKPAAAPRSNASAPKPSADGDPTRWPAAQPAS